MSLEMKVLFKVKYYKNQFYSVSMNALWNNTSFVHIWK